MKWIHAAEIRGGTGPLTTSLGDQGSNSGSSHRDNIPWQNRVSGSPFIRKCAAVHLDDGAAALDGDFLIGRPRVAAGNADGLQQGDLLFTLWKIVAVRPCDLAQNGETQSGILS